VPTNCDGALVLLGDMPEVTPIDDRMIAAFASRRPRDLRRHAPEYARQPRAVGKAFFPEFDELTGDAGAKPDRGP
jgi:CTP:molybdopterin cytidylyltransferase MocA